MKYARVGDKLRPKCAQNCHVIAETGGLSHVWPTSATDPLCSTNLAGTVRKQRGRHLPHGFRTLSASTS